MRQLRRLTQPTPCALAVMVLVVVFGGLLAATRQESVLRAIAVVVAAAVAAGAVALLPAVPPAPVLVAGLVVAVFSSHWGDLGLPVGLDRPLMLYGLAGAILRLLPDADDRWTVRVCGVHLLLAVVTVYAVGSALFAGTLFDAEPAFALSERLGIVGFALFTIAPRAFASPRSRDWLLGALIGLGAYLSFTGVMEGIGIDALVFPKYILDPNVGLNPERARGPFAESGSFGLALFSCGVAAAMGIARWRRPAVRLACAAVIGASGLAIVFTVTRQAWLGAAAGTLVAMLMSRRLRPWILPAGALAACGVALALVALPSLQSQASARAGAKLPVWDRLNSDRAAIAMILDKPLLGHGWYSFATASGPYLVQADSYPLRSVSIPHNVFLGYFAELGVIGGGLWLLALTIAIGSAVVGRAPPEYEPWRIGLVATSVAWVVVANLAPIGSAFTNYVLWLWPGVVWGGLDSSAVVRRLAAGRPLADAWTPARRGGLAVACAVACGALGLVIGLTTRSTRYEARGELTVGNVRDQARGLPYFRYALDRTAAFQSRLASSASVMDPAASRLGMPAEQLRDATVVTPVLNAPLVSVRATAGNPAMAVARATAVMRALADRVSAFNARARPKLELARRGQRAARREARRFADVDDAAGKVAEALDRPGVTLNDLPLAVQRPLLRAQAAQQEASRELQGDRLAYVALEGEPDTTDLHPARRARLHSDDRWSVAQRYGAIGLVLGAIGGALLGLFAAVRRSGRAATA